MARQNEALTKYHSLQLTGGVAVSMYQYHSSNANQASIIA